MNISDCLLAQINWGTFGLVMGIFFAIALVFAVLIIIITKICKVTEDEKVAEILENLGGSNCGGCGRSGCRAFAECLAKGEGNVTDCHSVTKEKAQKIAEILGVKIEEQEPTFAVVKCAGGINAAEKFNFVGYTGCSSVKSFAGGNKVCPAACLGGGECTANCPHGAIAVKDGVGKTDKSKCSSCGSCIIRCPQKIIERIPRRAKVYVACSSKCKGKEVISACKVGCIGCGICAKSCPEKAITMVENLPVIDYSKCSGCKTCAAKCPRHTIKEI